MNMEPAPEVLEGENGEIGSAELFQLWIHSAHPPKNN